jgi:hypothetical protein
VAGDDRLGRFLAMGSIFWRYPIEFEKKYPKTKPLDAMLSSRCHATT